MSVKYGLRFLILESLRRMTQSVYLHEKDNYLLISGNSNKELAQKVALELKKELSQALISRFNDGECNIQILDNVRGKDVFIIQSTCQPVNDNFMELLLMISALRRSSAKTINVIIPYFGYSRQDHIGYNRNQHSNRMTPISAAAIAKMLESSGADRVISIDLHRGQLQGFFSSIPVENLESYKPLLEQLEKEKFDLENVAIVSPDFNGVGRAVRFQDMLTTLYPNISTKIAMIYKAKQAIGPPIMSLVGDVRNKNCLVIDDIIDSGLTLTMANLVLKSEGAKLVYAFGTHPIMSNSAFERLSSSSIDRVYCADTIPENKKEQQFLGHKFQRVSIAAVIAEAILRIQNRSSQQLS